MRITGTGTGAPQPPTVAVLGSPTGGVGSLYMLVGSAIGDGDAASLFFNDGNPDQTLGQFDLAGSPPDLSSVLVTGAPNGGYLVKGPDGCVYLALSDTVYKITNNDGSCPLTASTGKPQLNLSPSTVTPSPAQGTSVTFTATVHYANNAADTPVTFLVSGANPQMRMVRADANGDAAFTYRALKSGTDRILAMATLDGTSVTSNTATVIWTTGVLTTALSLNSSSRSSIAEQNVTLSAQLLDVSLSPQAPLPNQSVVLAVGGESCSATTNAQGIASCQVDLTMIGQNSLTATYAGEAGNYTPASTTQSFTVNAAPPAPPAPPTAHNGSVSTKKGMAVSGTLNAGGTGPFTYAIKSQPHHGTVTLTNATTGAFTYTPAAGFSGTDSFTFTASNSGGTPAATGLKI